MAKVKTPGPIQHLITALHDGLKKAGIKAIIDSEKVPQTKLHRILVLADQFEQVPPSERQSLVWRIAQNVLTFDQQLLVSGIWTLTSEEAGMTEQGRPGSKKSTRHRKAV